MRETLFNLSPLFNLDHIKDLNVAINKYLIKSNDTPSTDAIKTSQLKFVHLRSIQNLIMPFLDFIITTNTYHYGFDLFQLTGSKILNYNTYEKSEEYTWHIDATMQSPVRDIKLTCLLNCSEESYEGGDLCLYRNKEVKIKDFNPGCAIVFPSFMWHRVTPVTSGTRYSLVMWNLGKPWR